MEHMNMQHEGHANHSEHHNGMMIEMKHKFWICTILTIPLILMTPMMGMKLPFQIIFPYSDVVVSILGTFLFIYGGMPFFKGAKNEFKAHKPAMMALITLGILVTYIYSIYSVVLKYIGHEYVMNYFWELATLIDIMLLGHYLEMKSVMQAKSAVSDLEALLPNTVHIVRDEKVVDVPLMDIKVGDTLEVRAGEKVPADSVIIKGKTTINESMITGESKPIKKDNGSQVIGGSVNGEGVIWTNVTAIGKESYLSKVATLVEEAQKEKSKEEALSDKVAGWLFYAAVLVAAVAFVIWLNARGLSFALSVAVTTLVIACPHALGLAIPLVILRSTSISARHGLVIRRRTAMEKANNLKYILMDKTGTLTVGDFTVLGYDTYTSEYTSEQILQIMASLEKSSTHPLAKGILDEYHGEYLPTDNITQITGAGVQGVIDSNMYQLVSGAYVNEHDLATVDMSTIQSKYAEASISYLIKDDKVIGSIAQGDTIKGNAGQFIEELKKQNIIPVMLTGDNKESAKAVANKLGIKEVYAELKPNDKAEIVEQYQAKGTTMMIGDGINDAISLSTSSIGVAIGSGTDVAIDSADIVLVNSNLQDVLDFLELAKRTTNKMKENLWWGAGYNIIALPLASGILVPFGLTLNPMVGAILMSLSTIIVALNAMTLKMK